MGNLLQNREGSATSHLTPHAFKGKQNQIGQGRQREMFTHFVSLPLATYPELKKNLEAFQNSILGNNNNDKILPLKFQNNLAQMGIEKSIFVSPKTFHLTVVMLKLENNESVVKAQNILKSISPNVRQALKNRPVFIRLRGLECMNGTLDKTRVLYVPVEEVGHEGRLLNACCILICLRAYFSLDQTHDLKLLLLTSLTLSSSDAIIDAFENAGFAGKDAKSRLKLHATVMNASYRKDKSKKMDTFDAREMHKEFGNKDWGTYLIREAHISQRYKYDPNGYFHCSASLPFPHK